MAILNLEKISNQFPPYFRDSLSGFEFESSTRETPKGMLTLRFLLRRRAICHVDAKDLGIHRFDIDEHQVYMVSKSEMRRNFDANMRLLPIQDRQLVGPLERILPMMLAGWKRMLEIGPLEHAGIVVDIKLE